MPSYDYRCADCDQVFEEFQRITADPGAVCPSCGCETCTRLISGGTFHLKGSGWYASDYNGSGRSGTASGRKDKGSSSSSPAAAPATPSPAASGGKAAPASSNASASSTTPAASPPSKSGGSSSSK